MIRTGYFHVVSHKSVFTAVVSSDVNARVEGIGSYYTGGGGQIFQDILFAENGRNHFNFLFGRTQVVRRAFTGDDCLSQMIELVLQDYNKRDIIVFHYKGFLFVVQMGKIEGTGNGAFKLEKAG